jgi:LPS-assembly lipoprotein
MSVRLEKSSPALREGIARPARGEPSGGAAARPPHPNPLHRGGRGSLKAWGRRSFLLATVAIPVSALTGCGWEPLYADRAAGPADADLAAIKVAPIPERVGQLLALKLRQWLNPDGAPVPTRYELRTLLQTTRLDLGTLQVGSATRARIEAYATFTLTDIASGAALFTSTSRAADSFDIITNYYSNVVAEQDARERVIEEIRRDMVSKLTVFLQRRTAEAASRP